MQLAHDCRASLGRVHDLKVHLLDRDFVLREGADRRKQSEHRRAQTPPPTFYASGTRISPRCFVRIHGQRSNATS